MDLFDGPKLKICRATRHLSDYRAAFKAFTEGPELMQMEPQVDPETGNLRVVIWRGPDSLPSELRLTAADALYNLRSALDQGCFGLRRAGRLLGEGHVFPAWAG